MKRFIITVLGVAVFFTGLGALVDGVGAKFKSDEKALELIKKAREAIGGDSAIAGVKSLRITGTTTKILKIDGVEKSEAGETEIAMQLPDKFMKITKIGHGDGAAGQQFIDKQVDVIVVGNDKDAVKVRVNGEGRGEGAGAGVGGERRKIVIRKDDGTVQELTGDDAAKWIESHPAGDGERTVVIKKSDGSVDEIKGGSGEKVFMRKADGGNATFTSKGGQTVVLDGDHKIFTAHASGAGHEGMRQNELLRTTLGLLLSAPQGMDVEYAFGGEGNMDGASVNIVNASFGGQSFKLYLDRISNLPVMLSYTGVRMPKVFTFTSKDAKPGDAPKDVIFTRKMDDAALGSVEFSVKFSDYRSVGGVQLPYKWTQTVGGNADETFEVTGYDLNPSDIADRFKDQKVMVRTRKPDGQ